MNFKIFRPSLSAVVLVLFCLQICPGFADSKSTLNLPSDIKISMDFKEADLKDVLKIFSQQSGLNFIASQSVQSQKVTMYFNNVTVEDALANIVQANSLRYERAPGSDIVVVYPIQAAVVTTVQTKVFPMKFTRLSGSALGVGGDGVISELSTAAGTGAVTTTTGTTSSKRRGIDEIASQFLSSQGKLTVDLRTNSLIVADLPENLSIIEEILKNIDVPAKQVMLDVHILEVRASVNEDIGMEYGGANGALGSITGGTHSTTFPFNKSLYRGFKSDPRVNSLTTATVATINDHSAEVTPSMTLGTISAANLTATLHYLTQLTDTKILARPRVLAMNNEAAIIRLVTKTSIANTSTSSSSGGALGATTSDVAERVDTGIILRMTPQINEDSSIELFIEPAVTTASASTFFPTTFLDPTTRSIRTTVRVQDNETLVIGGLIDTDATKSEKKLPIFGDLPLIGKAFRYDANDQTDRELMIFLTPHILKGEQPVESLSGRLRVQTGVQELMAKSAKQKSLFRERDVVPSFREAEMRQTLESLKRSKK